MKHTPGPWTHCGRTIYSQDIVVALAYNFCDTKEGDNPIFHVNNLQESYANAKLVAAAPKMAEAIKEALSLQCFNCDEMTKEYHAIYEKLSNSIRKAGVKP